MTTYAVTFSDLSPAHSGIWATLAEAVAYSTGVIAADGVGDPEGEGMEPLTWWEERFATPSDADGSPTRFVQCTYDHDGGETVTIAVVS